MHLILRIVEKVRLPQSSKRQYKELPSSWCEIHLSKHPRVYCEDDHSKKLVRTKESHFAPTARTMRPFRITIVVVAMGVVRRRKNRRSKRLV